MSLTTALLGSSAISGLGSLLGGATSSKGASSAAKTTAQATELAALLQQQQYQTTRADLQPYTQAGYSALDQLKTLLGLGTGGTAAGNAALSTASGGAVNGLTFNPTQATLESTPGYQWNLNQTLRAAEASGTTSGRGISGANQQAVAQAATNLANNTLTTQQGIYQQNLQNILSPLEYLTGVGQNAAATTASAGTSAANATSNILTSGASSTAASQIASSNAVASSLNSLGSNLSGNYLLYSALSNSSNNPQNQNPGGNLSFG